MKHHIEHFDTITELVAENGRRGTSPAFRNTDYRASNSHEGSDGWTQTPNYESAVTLLHDGWEEPLDGIRQNVMRTDRLDTAQSLSHAEILHDVRGSSVSVARYLIGHPKSMRRVHTEPMAQKTVLLSFGISASASVSGERLVKCGSCLLAAVNHLERLGIRVRLDIFESAYQRYGGSGDNFGWSLTVKHYREPLNLKKLAFPLCHPSMLRRISFRWLETSPIVTDEGLTSGYGVPIHHADDASKSEFERLIAPDGHVIYTLDAERADFDAVKMLTAAGVNMTGRRG